MTEEADIPFDRMVKIYRKIKARIDLLTQEYDTEVELLKGQQEQLKLAIKDQMKVLGLTSMRTEFGLVSMVIKTRYNTQDWDSFKTFIVEHEVVDLLEKRISQGNMATFLKENPGIVPPGLNSFTEFEIRITKPTN
jgi:hypothetical protein